MAAFARLSPCRTARHHRAVASSGLSPVLAMEAPRTRRGRPKIAPEIRDLIRRMGLENPLWGAPKIHGELLKLGIEVAQSTVSLYIGASARSAVTRLEDLYPQSRGGDGLNRSIRGSDHSVSAALCVSCSRPRTSPVVVVRGNPQSDRRLACSSDHGSLSRRLRNISFGTMTEPTAPHSGLVSERWVSGIADVVSVALAEWPR